jgi:two-component system, chemotaxis family, sensor kinase CheA
MVSACDHVFAIPSNIVRETVDVGRLEIRVIQQKKIMVFEKELIPFFPLQDLLDMGTSEKDEVKIGLILQFGKKVVGLGVSSVLDQVDNIIKPFDPIVRQFKGYSGGTILGDGSVALLLDIPNLIDLDTIHDGGA